MKNMNLKRMLCVGLCLLTVLCCLASCAKSEDALGDAMNSVTESAPGEAGASGNLSYDEIHGSKDGEQAENPIKIIRTVTMSAETQSFDEATALIQSTVGSLGGYVGSSHVQGSGLREGVRGSRYAEYTLRIPAEQLDTFLSAVGDTLHVTSTESQAEDVTNEYYDVEARLSVLEAERKLLEKMLSETTSVSNMISLEERLYDVIAEIESYESTLRVYDNKVAYSTVTLRVSEVVELTVAEETFGTRLSRALTESWENLLEGGQDLLIALIYAFPTLLILTAIGGMICGLILLLVRKKRQKGQKD